MRDAVRRPASWATASEEQVDESPLGASNQVRLARREPHGMRPRVSKSVFQRPDEVPEVLPWVIAGAKCGGRREVQRPSFITLGEQKFCNLAQRRPGFSGMQRMEFQQDATIAKVLEPIFHAGQDHVF